MAGLGAAQGDVLIVGPGGFSQVQAAVAAASDGDTILIRSQPAQPYQAVDIAGKALTIASDLPSGDASIRYLRVHDIPAGKSVVLTGLRMENGLSASPILLQNNAGSVRLVRCTALSNAYYKPPALRIANSSGTTALASCAITAGGEWYNVDGFDGGKGLDIVNTRAAVFDSTLTGGEGGYSYIGTCGIGGTGATVVHAGLPTKLLLANSTVQGGRGGNRLGCFYVYEAGDGGPGLVVSAGAAVSHQATSLAGGAGGDGNTCGTDGASGAPIVNSGTVLSVPRTAFQLTTPTIAHEGETITLTFEGTLGDRVTVVAGAETIFDELLGNVLLVRPGATPPTRGVLGAIGPSGVLTVPYKLPLLPPGIDAANLWFQGLALHANGKRSLGSFSVVTVLDSGL